MKVLHLSARDIEGGAARAAYRLHRGLLNYDVYSRMHVQFKCDVDPLISGLEGRIGRFFAEISYLADSIPVFYSRYKRGNTFSPAILPDRVIRHVEMIAPDIIHLHWISGGFIRLETIPALKYPIVWTFHDMWPFTGGCHFSGECIRYSGSCGLCPELSSKREDDLSRKIWRRKAHAWQELPLTIIVPSLWMAQCVRMSSLFSQVETNVIPNCIDIKIFRPQSALKAREILGLPCDRQLILFGAMSPRDPRKGFRHLLPAIKDLVKNGWGETTELIIFGTDKSRTKPDFGMKAYYMGHVCDEHTMALLYTAADVFVAPSIQDNLPNTVMEALACGTPVVAFNTGGMPEMIDHRETGWLAHPFDYRDIAKGIIHVIEDVERREIMGRLAREKVVRNYAEDIVIRQHMKLYDSLVGQLRI